MKTPAKRKDYLLVDGYNIIYAWSNLRKTAEHSLENARDKLIRILQNYQGYHNNEIIIVFDAHKVTGGTGELAVLHNITVVYTHEAETADHYIERVSKEMSAVYNVTVATSDNLEQVIILGAGAKRMSALDLRDDVLATEKKINMKINASKPIKNNPFLDNLDSDTATWLEAIRMGKNYNNEKR